MGSLSLIFRLETAQGCIVAGQSEKRLEERQRLSQIRIQVFHASAQFLPCLKRVVALFDAKDDAQDLEDRTVGNGQPACPAMPFQPAHPTRSERSPEFVQQTGFAEPRLTHDSNGLAVAGFSAGQPRTQLP